jgi:hypothetical protein
MSNFSIEHDASGKIVVKANHDPEQVAAYQRKCAEQERRIKAQSAFWRERDAVARLEAEAAASPRTASKANELPRKTQDMPVKFRSLVDILGRFKNIIGDRFDLVERRIAELEKRK